MWQLIIRKLKCTFSYRHRMHIQIPVLEQTFWNWRILVHSYCSCFKIIKDNLPLLICFQVSHLCEIFHFCIKIKIKGKVSIFILRLWCRKLHIPWEYSSLFLRFSISCCTHPTKIIHKVVKIFQRTDDN